MNVNAVELWGGATMLVLSAVLLMAPFVVVVLEHTLPLLVVSIMGIAVGSVLIGLSRRGRMA